jgi:formate hydrogenlyase transcriptional activator
LRLDLAMSDILHAPAAAVPEAHETKRQLLTDVEMRDLERKNTQLALEMAEWRVSGPSGAAKLLGVKPTTLTDRMKKFQLRKPA